jgi:mannosyl-oligosaccharide alpha-1,2-mannosidase
MYRITGDVAWQEKGWAMFEAIINTTSTTFGHSAVVGVTEEKPELTNSMESFWLSETLKYFYLLYSEPDVLSLDEWVLNTEAHAFRRPT